MAASAQALVWAGVKAEVAEAWHRRTASGWQRWVANINASQRSALFNVDGELLDTVKYPQWRAVEKVEIGGKIKELLKWAE